MKILRAILQPLLDAFDGGGGGGSFGSGGGAASGDGAGGQAQGGGASGPGGGAGDGRGGAGTGGGSFGTRGQQGAGQGQGGPQGAGGQSAQVQTGSGTDSVFDLRDDARIRTQDGRVMTAREYRTELETGIRRDYDGRYQQGYNLLLNEARRLDQLRQQNGQGQGQGGQRGQQQQESPLDRIRSSAIVDGESIHQLVQHLEKTGLQPIANLVRSMASEVGQLKQQIQQFGGHIGSQNEERAAQDFENRLTKTLGSIDVKGLNGKLDPSHEGVREFARNLYLSYDPSSWKAGEYEQMLSQQLEKVVDYVRTLDRSHVTQAQQRLRSNFNPQRGNASPTGDRPYKFQSGRAIAQMGRDMGMFNAGGGGGRT